MAITKELRFKKLDIDIENCAISIAFIPVYLDAGVEDMRGKLQRAAFVPGEIEKVKAFTGLGDTNKHIKYINSLWTAQVIADYQASLEE